MASLETTPSKSTQRANTPTGLTDEQLAKMTPEEKDKWWFENVYIGDKMSQLTWRSIKQDGAGLKAVGEAWPVWVRGATVLAQLCVPAAVLATMYAVLENDFDPSVTGTPAMIARGAWLIAFAAMVPAIVLVIDLSRSASDDPSLGRFLSGAWGMVVGSLLYMVATSTIPSAAGFSGLFGILVAVLALALLPLSGMFVIGLFSLWSTCRWAPRNKVEAEERLQEKIRRDTERGNQEAAASYFRGD